MPISDCAVRDPRIRRTRQLLHRALRTLLQSRSFDELSVQDIADEATVNRATFYDHYTDKFALFEAMVAGEFHQLLEERKVQFNGACASSAAPVVLATCDFLARCSHPTGANKDHNAFEALADAAIANAIRRVLMAGMNPRHRRGKIPIEMIASAASGALYGAVKEWLHLRRRPPAEEIVPAVVELVGPMLSPVCSQAAHLEVNGKSARGHSRRHALKKTRPGAG